MYLRQALLNSTAVLADQMHIMMLQGLLDLRCQVGHGL